MPATRRIVLCEEKVDVGRAQVLRSSSPKWFVVRYLDYPMTVALRLAEMIINLGIDSTRASAQSRNERGLDIVKR